MKKSVIVSLALCLLVCLFTLTAALANEMVLTFSNGGKQSVALNQDSKNIAKIEFTGGTAAPQGAVSETQINYVKGFAGKWNTNWGVLDIAVSGTSIIANYTHDQGKMLATLSSDGKTLDGTWAEYPSYSPPKDGGRATLTLSNDGNSIAGHWWYSQDTEGGPWTGTRIN